MQINNVGQKLTMTPLQPAQSDTGAGADYDRTHLPAIGELVPLRPGIIWVRLPLATRIQSVNTFLIADGDHWAIVDAGPDDDHTRATWLEILKAPDIAGRISRVIATHGHFDHVGAAGWLCRMLDVPLYMSRVEYLVSRNSWVDPEWKGRPDYQRLLHSWGVLPDVAAQYAEHTATYPTNVAELPDRFVPIEVGDELVFGNRRFAVTLGAGHSPAQVLMHCVQDGIFLSADQVLPFGAPLLIQPDFEPQLDTYAQFLASLDEIEQMVPAESLILPGHGGPFHDIRSAIGAHRAHHAGRCIQVLEACQTKPHCPVDFADALFGPNLNARQLGLAVSEIIAYANFLHAGGKIDMTPDPKTGVLRLSV